MKYQRINSTDDSVAKFVFEGEDIAVEAVLYRYPAYRERTVICCSTQCGCPVGCTFCGTGKFFVRNLLDSEIIEQVTAALDTIDCDPSEIKKFQIMFMSMGEPFFNYNNLESAITYLHNFYPTAQLLVSTSFPKCDTAYYLRFVELSRAIDNIGLQFSVHESSDRKRGKLLCGALPSLETLSLYGELWARETGRKPFFNYCVHKHNSADKNIEELLACFNPAVWECTLSVI
jgi:23S rRNA (adenine2503-C2)-methyltransferase